MRDSVDQLLVDWAATSPGVDTTSLGVIQRVVRIGRLAEKRLRRRVANQGIRVRGDYEVLAALRRKGALTGLKLAEEVMVSTSAITGRLDRLEEASLVVREIHPQDRRSVLASLTVQGRDLTDAVFRLSVEEQEEMLGSLTTEEVIELTELLRRLLAFLEEGGGRTESP